MVIEFTVNGKVISKRTAWYAPELVSVGGAWIDGITFDQDTPLHGLSAKDGFLLIEMAYNNINESGSDSEETETLRGDHKMGYRLNRDENVVGDDLEVR